MLVYTIEYVSNVEGEIYSEVQVTRSKGAAIVMQNCNIDCIAADIDNEDWGEENKDSWGVELTDGNDTYKTTIVEHII